MSTDEVAYFFKGEQLGTTLEPKCGACHCGRCPMPGFRYSFREEAEQNLIQEQMLFNKEKQRWVAGYPYLFPKEYQKGMQCLAWRTMLGTKKRIQKNKSQAGVYHSQIQSMVD